MNQRRHTRASCAHRRDHGTDDVLHARLEAAVTVPAVAMDWQDVLQRVDGLGRATAADAEIAVRSVASIARQARPVRACSDHRPTGSEALRVDVARAPAYSGDALGWGTRGL